MIPHMYTVLYGDKTYLHDLFPFCPHNNHLQITGQTARLIK